MTAFTAAQSVTLTVVALTLPTVLVARLVLRERRRATSGEAWSQTLSDERGRG